MKRLALSSRFTWVALILSIMVIAPAMLIGPSSQADNGPQHRVRTLQFGSSGGNVNDISRRFCCSGTLGSLLTDGTRSYILSNNHVMGLSGSATAGQDISQPGLIDNGCRVSTVVADFTVAPALSTGVDAAIAELRPGLMDANGSILDIGTISSVVKTPTIGLNVQKSGRTTGHTTGTISSISATVNVRYPTSCGANNGPVFTFTNQVVVGSSSFSAGGDSGSLIVTTGSCPQPVALLFAGSSTSTIGNPASVVLARVSAALGRTVSFVGGTCGTAARVEPDLGLSEDAVARVNRIKERNENRIMSRRSVIGFGIGASDNDPTQPVFVVYVDESTGFRPRLPKKIDGVPVKVVYTDTFVAF